MINISKIIIITFFFVAVISAQTNSINGIVTDKKTGEPLPGVNVFISNTFVGTTTDLIGEFFLQNIPPGQQTLIISMVGYERVIIQINFNIDTQPLKIELEDKTYELENINIVVDESKWEYYYSIFTDEFIGRRRYGDDCEILNPYSINFYHNPDTDILTATCDSTLVLKNFALGYQINILLEQFDFHISHTPRIGSYFFYHNFIEMQPENEIQLIEWQENRSESYLASPRCFFKNILNSTISDEDYLYRCIPYYIDSTYFLDSSRTKFYYKKSINRYNINLNYIKIEYDETLDCYYLEAPFDLKVNPLIAKWSGFSEIVFINEIVTLNYSGRVINHNEVKYNGYWAKFRVSDLLPDEYIQPIKKEK